MEYAYLGLVVYISSIINQCLDNLGMSTLTCNKESSKAVLLL